MWTGHKTTSWFSMTGISIIMNKIYIPEFFPFEKLIKLYYSAIWLYLLHFNFSLLLQFSSSTLSMHVHMHYVRNSQLTWISWLWLWQNSHLTWINRLVLWWNSKLTWINWYRLGENSQLTWINWIWLWHSSHLTWINLK